MPRPFRARKAAGSTVATEPETKSSSTTTSLITKANPTKGTTAPVAKSRISTRRSKAAGLDDEAISSEVIEGETEEKENRLNEATTVNNAPLTRRTRGASTRKEPLQNETPKKTTLMEKLTKAREGITGSSPAKRNTRSIKSGIATSTSSVPKRAPIDGVSKLAGIARRAISPKKANPPKSQAVVAAAAAAEPITMEDSPAPSVRKDKGKGRAIDEERMAEDEIATPAPEIQVEATPPPPSSPPPPLLNVGEDDESSVYGDENFLPNPLAQSTPKGAGPLTPQKNILTFGSDEGYTPPSKQQSSKYRLPVPAEAGPSSRSSPMLKSPIQLSPVRRRLWESSSVVSSPSQSHKQDEPVITASMEDIDPLGFDIYEDSPGPGRERSMVRSPIRGDGRGDGADDNVLRTPKKKVEVTRKRTSSGGQKTPDGQIVEEEDEEATTSEEDSDSELSEEEEEEEKPPSPPKRQRKVKKIEPLSTKQLLDLAPKRRGGATARRGRNGKSVEIFDDMGELGTSSTDGGESEDEITQIMRKPSGAKATNKKKVIISKKSSNAGRVVKPTTKTKSTVTRAITTTITSRKATTTTPRKRLSSAAPQSASTKPVAKTYGRKGAVPERESSADLPELANDSLSPINSEITHTSEDENGRIDKEGKRKLKEIRKKFEEVDEWEMEFEDVTVTEDSGR